MSEPPTAGLTQKSAKGAAWAGISRGVQQAIQMVSVPVLARLLSPDDYGLMSASAFFVNLLQQLGDMGTGSAIVQREQISVRLTSSLFWINLVLGVAAAGAIWLAAPAVAAYYKDARVILPLSVMALSFPVTGLGIVSQSLLIRALEYRKLSIIEISAAVGGTVVAVTVAWQGAGVWSLVAGSLSMSVINTSLSLLYAGWRPAWVIDWSEVRPVLGFSANLTGFVVVNYLSRNTGHLVVGRFLGTEALGYYHMAYLLLLYPLQAASSVLGRVMFSALARIQTEPERLRLAMLRYLTLLGAVQFPVFLGLLVIAAPMIVLFLGEKWTPVTPLFMILAPLGAVQSISSPSGQIFLSTGRTDVMFRLGVGAMVVQVLGYLVGLPWGVRGVVIGWALSCIPVAWAGLFISHRIIGAGLGPLLRNLQPLALAAGAMAALTWGWRLLLERLGIAWPVFDLTSSIALGVVLYLVLVVPRRPAFLRDIEEILSYSDHAVLVWLRGWVARYAPPG